MARLLTLLGLLFFLGTNPLPARAQPGSGPDGSWRWLFQGAAVKQFGSGLDSGGDLEVERYFISGGATRQLASRWRLGVELGYGEDRYAFSGHGVFGAQSPWGTARELRLSLPMRYVADDRWTLLAIPSLRFHAEDGASLNDGQTQGLLAGAIYRVNESLSIGPGFGAFSEIEDNASLFPVLLIDWRLTDKLSLRTGGGFAASRGPGLQLTWKARPQWEFAFGGRYERARFRLDDEGVAPDGVAQERGFPLYVSAEYGMSKETKLRAIGGAKVGTELRLEDETGRLISETGVDTAPFLGALLEARF